MFNLYYKLIKNNKNILIYFLKRGIIFRENIIKRQVKFQMYHEKQKIPELH